MTGEELPEFFVPLVDADKQEEVYAELARIVGSPIPPHGKRVQSITFTHDGVEWTANVGGKLYGTQYVTVRSKGQRVERKRLHSDNATVMAIFSGHPWHVWHDNNRSHWENPFLVGNPLSVQFFR